MWKDSEIEIDFLDFSYIVEIIRIKENFAEVLKKWCNCVWRYKWNEYHICCK